MNPLATVDLIAVSAADCLAGLAGQIGDAEVRNGNTRAPAFTPKMPMARAACGGRRIFTSSRYPAAPPVSKRAQT